jgi:amidohydrolase
MIRSSSTAVLLACLCVCFPPRDSGAASVRDFSAEQLQDSGAASPGDAVVRLWGSGTVSSHSAAVSASESLSGDTLDVLRAEIDARVVAVEEKAVAWRRDIHQHPELGNREFRTAGIVAEHLRGLGMEVRTGVAHTGVVGVLRGGLPGPVVAVRADMDALPVTEMVDLPFASRATGEYMGQKVGVMHACGHDLHTAIGMGTAEVLAGIRDRLPGTVVFIFQPAEEGAPPGEEGGAALMIAEGALEGPRPEAIFGLHVWTAGYTGMLGYRPGGILASSQTLRMVVHGTQTHGAMPWNGVDPIVTASQIVLGLQTIVSRQVDLTTAPAVVTIGMIQGGIRHNIIPDSVVLVGTVRTLDPGMKGEVEERIRRVAQGIASGAGARVEVELTSGIPVTYNDPELTRRMAPTLERVAGREQVREIPPGTAAEDFSFFQQEIPGLYLNLGVVPDTILLEDAAPVHSPWFFADEGALPVGIRTMANLVLDFLGG